MCPRPRNTAQIATSRARIVQLFIVMANSIPSAWLGCFLARFYAYRRCEVAKKEIKDFLGLASIAEKCQDKKIITPAHPFESEIKLSVCFCLKKSRKRLIPNFIHLNLNLLRQGLLNSMRIITSF